MSVFNTLKRGQQYLNSWPLEPKLALMFPENRIIKATQFAQKFMPFVAVFAIVWRQVYARGDIISLAVAALTAIFALCIPLQGLYWLGKRANMRLPSRHLVWFYKIYHRLQEVGVVLPIIKDKPNYSQLAQVLNKAQKHLGPKVWYDI